MTKLEDLTDDQLSELGGSRAAGELARRRQRAAVTQRLKGPKPAAAHVSRTNEALAAAGAQQRAGLNRVPPGHLAERRESDPALVAEIDEIRRAQTEREQLVDRLATETAARRPSPPPQGRPTPNPLDPWRILSQRAHLSARLDHALLGEPRIIGDPEQDREDRERRDAQMVTKFGRR